MEVFTLFLLLVKFTGADSFMYEIVVKIIPIHNFCSLAYPKWQWFLEQEGAGKARSEEISSEIRNCSLKGWKSFQAVNVTSPHDDVENYDQTISNQL